MARGTCWEGYEQKGFKKKGSKSVPNCVKVGTMKGDMIKKPVKAFLGGMFKKSATATASSDGGGSGGSDSSLMGLLGKSGLLKSFKDVTVLGNTSAKPLGNLQTKQLTAKAYTGKFIDVELDGKKYSNASKKNYYKGMI